MVRFAALLVILGLPLAGCAGNSGAKSASTAPAATQVSSSPTVFDLQRQINQLQTQMDLMREQIRELQTGQAGKTL
jgi:outer membrane murein-binding lipoprotein Lpp